MSAHVLLNLLNELGKKEKMRGLPSIFSLFRNEFDKFINKGVCVLDAQKKYLIETALFSSHNICYG